MKLFHKTYGQSRSVVHTLATYLFLFSLTALLLVSSMQLYSYITSYQDVISKNQNIIARDAAKSVSSFIKEKINVLDAVIWMNNPIEVSADEQMLILQSLLGLQPSFREIIIADEKDSSINSISRRSRLYSERNLKPYRNEAYNECKNNLRYISPVYIDGTTKEPILMIALPIRTVLNEFTGSIYAEINLKFMWDLVDQISIGETGYAYVVDSKGTLIAFGDASRVLKNENISSLEPVSKFIKNRGKKQPEDVSIFNGIKNNFVVGTYASLNTPEWAVITELPVTEAYRKIFIELIISGIILVLAALSIGFIGFIIAKKLSVPLIELMNTATSIANGQRYLKAKLKGPREVEALADAFNSMTSQLNKSMKDLEEKYVEIKNAQQALKMSQYSIDMANDAIFWVNREALFTYVNDQACISLGYSREELLNMTLNDIDPLFDKDLWITEWDSYKKELSGQGKKIETFHKQKDGNIFPVEVSTTHIWFDDTELHVAYARNITERKEAEKAIKEKTEELNNFFTSALDLLCIADMEGVFRRLNLEWETTLGYSVDELNGTNFISYVHPDDVDVTLKAMNKLSNRETILNFVNRYRCKDGSYRWIEWRSFPTGKLIYAAARDITDRKIVEEQLRISQFSIDQSMDGVYWINKEAGFTYVNEQACRSLGYTREELLSLKLWDIDPKYPKERWFANWEDYQIDKQGGYERVETFHKRKDGTIFPVEVNSRHIWFGDTEFHLANVRDISDRIKVENELRTKEAQLSLAIKTASLGHWEYNIGTQKFTFNDLFYSMFRTSVDDVGGYELSIDEYATRFIPPEKRDIVRDTISNLIHKSGSDLTIELEHPIIYGDGSSGFISVKCNAEVDNTGKVIHIYGVNQDITDRIIYERELVYAKEEAEKSDKLKTEFLAQMSHEIRTPINTILSFISLLKTEIENSCDNELTESFSIIDGAGRRLIRTIDLILNMSQIQTNTYEINPKQFNLYSTIMRDLLAEYTQLAEVKNLQFNIFNKSTNPNIYADEYTVIQIFENLLNNAFKYTSKGSIKLILENNFQNNLIVQVADTGIGISEEFIPNLFNPFMQEEGGYTRKYEGNGLGLALVKKYCDLNNATIMVSSSKAKGTTFTVEFKTT